MDQILSSKICTKCHIDKSLKLFWKRNNVQDGRMSHCIDCRQTAKNSWESRNPGKHAEATKRWRKNNKDRVNETRRLYLQENELYREAAKKRSKQWAENNLDKKRKWYIDNKEKIYHLNHKYRASKRKVFDESVQKSVLYTQALGMCKGCKAEITYIVATIDHIIPLSRGGRHSYKNTQIMCRSCNSRKKDNI